jgi:hypothetical protein
LHVVGVAGDEGEGCPMARGNAGHGEQEGT